MKRFISKCCACLVLQPLSVYAVDGLDSLFELDLEQLAQVSVSTASKRSEKISDAPSVVSVITQDEIRNFGGNNLQDILRRAPGIYTVGSFTIRDSVSSIRGHLSDAIDRHQLVLLNGRPMRESYAGGINTQIYRAIPLDAIEKIEIIRGPGSVLYGTNAFAGVINIVTNNTKAPPDKKNKLSIGYGSFDTKQIDASTYQSFNDISVYAAARFIDSEGFRYKAFDAGGTYNEDDFSYDDYGAFAQIQFGNLKLDMFRGVANDLVFGLNPFWPFSYYEKERTFVDLQYDHKFSNNWNAVFNITYNGHNIEHQDQSFIGAGHNWIYEANIQGNITEKLRFMAGGSYNDLRVSDKPSTTHTNRIRTNNIWQNAYAQFDYTPKHWLKVTAGIQLNDDNRNDLNFSPRIATIFNLSEKWSAKLLYGNAFRSPYAAETSINIPGVVNGNPSLKPEKIDTYDAQLSYQTNLTRLALSLFMSDQKDTVILDSANQTFINSGDVEYYGFEFEGKHKVSQNLEIQGSISYQTNEDSNGLTGTTLIPEWMVKAGINYSMDNGITIGIFNNYFSEPTDRNSLNPKPTINSNTEAKAYHHLTVNVKSNLGNLLNNKSFEPFNIELFADNLLEDDPIYFPDLLTPLVNTLPQRSGRAFYGKISINF